MIGNRLSLGPVRSGTVQGSTARHGVARHGAVKYLPNLEIYLPNLEMGMYLPNQSCAALVASPGLGAICVGIEGATGPHSAAPQLEMPFLLGAFPYGAFPYVERGG